jgi:choline-sulfatase
LNRRDFLKLAGAVPLALALPPAVRRSLATAPGTGQNVIIVVFDAWSAANVSLYGYGRKTTPNIDRLAQRAIVYHNHQAAANFTTPGTASILTGTYPWTHKATTLLWPISSQYKHRSLFAAFDDYFRLAYTHNPMAGAILEEFSQEIQRLPEVESLYLQAAPAWFRRLFHHDRDAALAAWSRVFAIQTGASGYSLFGSRFIQQEGDRYQLAKLRSDFPRGLPGLIDNVGAFVIETAIDWLLAELAEIPRPFLTYFHLLPPHNPYNTSAEFADAFKGDGFEPASKPRDPLAPVKGPEFHANRDLYLEQRRYYDEFILYADAQFGDLYGRLEAAGHLKNTWLILTSDHGEMFERGLVGHATTSLYEPEIRVPLLIFEPGRTARLDVHERTSAVDLVPTLCQLTGHAVPTWAEGAVLPPFAVFPVGDDRSVFSFVDKHALGALNWTATSIRWPYKAMYFNAYSRLHSLRTVNQKGHKILETLGRPNTLLRLFDLESDPDELRDLATELPDVVQEMLPPLEAALGNYFPST